MKKAPLSLTCRLIGCTYTHYTEIQCERCGGYRPRYVDIYKKYS